YRRDNSTLNDREIVESDKLNDIGSNSSQNNLKILEIGSGSGAIAISLAKYIENANVVSLDISDKALEIANKNAVQNCVEDRVQFIKSNLFEVLEKNNLDIQSTFDCEEKNKSVHSENIDKNIDKNICDYVGLKENEIVSKEICDACEQKNIRNFDDAERVSIEKFDFIISNPPYIRKSDIEGLSIDVKNYEPHLALDGGEDGLDFYRKITLESKKYLKKGGVLAYEVGYDQAEDVISILKENGYSEIYTKKDLQGFDRVVIGSNL
ncbi:MAG: peptide chain release factor N(5)-glutamine methyltransferase, partial [Clostridioides sp.]|nr:peptide chain release factor N(5)-glutamine methyltransferase [Clostridioides sp.]